MIKNTIKSVLLLLAVFVSAQASAQTLLEKLQKFAGPEDVMVSKDDNGSYFIEGQGTLYLTDGTTQDGIIRFDLPNETCIQFTEAGKSRSKQICSKKIVRFTIGEKQFYAIAFKESSLSIGKDKIFMEMINNTPNDKFRLYYQRRQVKNTSTMSSNTGPYEVDRNYFVMLPGWDKAYDINDLKFTPFAKKMSEQLKDCPALSKKIADKEEGYKVNMFKGAANTEVYIRIMEEYNTCGQ